MKPERAILVERGVLVAGFLFVVIAVVAFDWRVGLLVFGIGLVLSAMDLRLGRRP